MKKKITLIALLAALSTVSFASERDDLKYIDELYKNRNYKVAVLELEGFLKKYPTSRRIKDIQLRLAKTYFLRKDYENSKKYFDIVLINHLALVQSFPGDKQLVQIDEILIQEIIHKSKIAIVFTQAEDMVVSLSGF